MKQKKAIIFGYSCTPSYGYFGVDDGGFSVALSADGEFVYKTYIYDHEEHVRDKVALPLPMEIVEEISAVITRDLSQLNCIPERLDNGSSDGVFSCFTFFGKEITDLNMSYRKSEEVAADDSAYGEEYQAVHMHETFILKVFDEIVTILKKINIELTLHNIEMKKMQDS